MAALLLLIAAGAGALLWPKGSEAPTPRLRATGLAALLERGAEGFSRADQAWRFRFPADHAAHSDYRTELWLVTGTLSDREGRRFGFQLRFLRLGVNPPATPMGPSAWAAHDVYQAQFALTDVAGGDLHSDERVSRAAMGMSGSEASPVRVWLEDWSLEARGGGDLRLRAGTKNVGLTLTLRNSKPPVLRSADGFHAYAMTRLRAEGTIRIGGRSIQAGGLAWLDRAWGEIPMPVGPVAWDRFLLQLDDGRELAVLRLRRRDGSGEPVLAGLLVDDDGTVHTLAHDDLTAEVLGYWPSPRDGTRYPARWRLQLPARAITLQLTPHVADQEADLSLRYWSGVVEIMGMQDGRALQGNGYVELLGYEPAPARR